ncbi:MAG: cytochrome c biogenesis CcdA family protein [Chloroflexota bacterium]
MGNISIAVAFGGGVLSFLSPCVLPLVPVYLASLVGPVIFEPSDQRFHLSVFFHALSFVLAFSIVFTLFGAGTGIVGSALSPYLAVLDKVAGSLLVVFGLFLLAGLKVPWLNFEKRLSPSKGVSISYLRSFLTGGVFTLAWTPCVGPILGGILALALGSGTAWEGAYLLAAYSLGLGLPFLVIGAAFGSLTPLLRRIHHYSTAIYIFSGILLISLKFPRCFEANPCL